MGKALYRKYRSRSLDEVIGQEHVTKTLAQALKQQSISHAYLFTGPRGVGKTSVARILAHEVNGLPYTDDVNHIDIIEIDAASNRRIDEIRDLREKVHIAPSMAKYKVYIIDEVHMLTKEAFNALLKTLEEPPQHVIFILATTDAHKLPDTIISRTQRFTFKPAQQQAVADLLQSLAKKEGITISSEAALLLAEHGDGSFRDSVSLLDQAGSHSKNITVLDVEQLLGVPPADAIVQLLTELESGETVAIMQQLQALYDQGFQAAAIAKQLGHELRLQMLKTASRQKLDLLGDLLKVAPAHNPSRYLEIVLLQHTTTNSVTPAPAVRPAAPKAVVATPDASSSLSELVEPEPKQDPKPTTPSAPGISTGTLSQAEWPAVLTELKKRHNTLYGVVRMAEPDFSETGTLLLGFSFPFHQKRLNEAGNRQALLQVIQDVTGQQISVECTLTDSKAKNVKTSEAKPVKQTPPEDITAISNIFGGAELLES